MTYHTGGLHACVLPTSTVPTSTLARLEHLTEIRRMSLEGEVFLRFVFRRKATGGLQYVNALIRTLC